MDILSTKIVTTRKDHLCNGCQSNKPKGSRMHMSFIVDGGDHWMWRECETCIQLRHLIPDPDNEYPDGWALEFKNDDNFSGSIDEYLDHVKAIQKATQP